MTVLVPRDLLCELDGSTGRAAPPSTMRVLVTVWVLVGGRGLSRTDFRTVGLRARALWPSERLNRGGRLTVLGVLLELDTLGVVSSVTANGRDFEVTVGEEQAA